MPIDFNRPTTARLYATEFIPDITQAFAALGRMLDPAVAGTLTNTPSGAHRLNSGAAGGGIFEWFNGSVWAERSMAYPKKDGAGATGTWGISISGNAATATTATTATSANAVAWANVSGKPALVSESFAEAATGSTLAKRTSSGYLNAVHFNQSSGNSENPAVSQVMVTNGSDGYLRKASIGHLGAALTGSNPAAKASTVAQNGGGGSAMTFNWSGQSGQPTWLWGGNDGANMYVWNPSNFSVANATNATNATSAANGAKAWVNFNGSGTVAIRASYNVSSITDNGVGIYTVNFATAMADASYAVACSARTDTTGDDGYLGLRSSGQGGSYSASAVTVKHGIGFAYAPYDAYICNVTVFR